MQIARNSKILFGISLLALATPVWAQDSAPAETPAETPAEAAPAAEAPAADAAPATDALPADIDPARFAIAEQIVALTIPNDRAAWVNQMMDVYAGTRMNALRENDETKQLLRRFPQMRRPFEEFLAAVLDAAGDVLLERLPALQRASAIGYARTYDVNALNAILGFMQTPNGLVYAQHLNEVALAPELAEWQQNIEQAIEAAGLPAAQEYMRAAQSIIAKDTDQNEP